MNMPIYKIKYQRKTCSINVKLLKQTWINVSINQLLSILYGHNEKHVPINLLDHYGIIRL